MSTARYNISGNETQGFTIQFLDGTSPDITICPCCDKPLMRRRNAETLANNLVRLFDATDALNERNNANGSGR